MPTMIARIIPKLAIRHRISLRLHTLRRAVGIPISGPILRTISSIGHFKSLAVPTFDIVVDVVVVYVGVVGIRPGYDDGAPLLVEVVEAHVFAETSG